MKDKKIKRNNQKLISKEKVIPREAFDEPFIYDWKYVRRELSTDLSEGAIIFGDEHDEEIAFIVNKEDAKNIAKALNKIAKVID